MKTWLTCLGLVFILFILTGCGGQQPITQETQIFDITITTSPLPHTVLPSQTSTVTPTAEPTETVTPQLTQTPVIFSAWANISPIASFPGYRVNWAKSENAFLFQNHYSGEEHQILRKVASPDFNPVILTPAVDYDDFTWSPDSQSIIYATFKEEGPGYKQIFRMDKDGNNAQGSGPEYGIHWVTFREWLDQSHLICTQYSGGGHFSVFILDITTKNVEPWGAFIHGDVFPQKNGYIPVTSNTGNFDPRLMVVSKNAPYQDNVERASGNLKLLPDYQSVPRLNTISTFEDWLPNTNQMLVFWGRFDMEFWEPQEHNLLLWDVEKNSVRLIAPNGRGGKFSPDGKILAYLITGSSQVDQNQTTVEGKPATEQANDYIQLLEMSTGKVIMSLPVLARLDKDDEIFKAHGYLKADFSPDGRYLTFLSPGNVPVDGNGWPGRLEKIDSKHPTLNLLDLQERKLVWSVNVVEDENIYSWSPDSQSLVYQDHTHNWHMLKVTPLKTIPLTASQGEGVSGASWSYDGRYFVMGSCSRTSENTCEDILHVFDVTLIK